MKTQEWKWLVVTAETADKRHSAGEAVSVIGFRRFDEALAEYQDDLPETGLKVLLKRVPGIRRPYWSLVLAERFGKFDMRISKMLERAGLNWWEIAL